MSNVLINRSNLENIASAIRSKNGESARYKPREMAAAIGRISGGYPEPTGTVQITTNGTHNVKDYASAQVNVQPNLQSKTATQNGTVTPDSGYDGLSSVVVDVSGEPTLPSEYQEVEYIESTGTQYTTPMVLTLPSNSLIIIRFARMSGTNEQAAFGAHSNIELTSGIVDIYIGSGASTSGVSAYGYSRIWKAYESGTTGSPCSAAVQITTNLADAYIALCKYKTYTLNGRLYMCSIYKLKDAISPNPYELMFKGVPCYRKSDGVIGFYELVSGTFLTNAGSGSFGKGPDV